MKKYLLLLTASLSLTVSRGQTNVYHPFPADSAVWVYHHSTPLGNNHYEYVQWLGDTTINSVVYKKETHRFSYSPPGWTYSGGVRQDILNEKIYKIDNSGVEHDVSVNQHLVIGDTLPLLDNGLSLPYCSPFPYDTFIIVATDSVKVGAKYHKRYLSNYASYIVGVGIGQQFHSNPTVSIGLSCFSVDNVYQYGSSYSCQLVSTNEFSINKSQLFVSPNPFSSHTTLQTAKPFQNASLTVYNSVGQTVKRVDNLAGQTIIFHRDNLPSGLYFVRLTQDGNTISADKFVITDK